jgi:hypothetical protein
MMDTQNVRSNHILSLEITTNTSPDSNIQVSINASALKSSNVSALQCMYRKLQGILVEKYLHVHQKALLRQEQLMTVQDAAAQQSLREEMKAKAADKIRKRNADGQPAPAKRPKHSKADMTDAAPTSNPITHVTATPQPPLNPTSLQAMSSSKTLPSTTPVNAPPPNTTDSQQHGQATKRPRQPPTEKMIPMSGLPDPADWVRVCCGTATGLFSMKLALESNMRGTGFFVQTVDEHDNPVLIKSGHFEILGGRGSNKNWKLSIRMEEAGKQSSECTILSDYIAQQMKN